ncbi:MAG: HAD-superfamily hydrolase, subfamily variant 3 [Herbinix sp.]|nr:HAD-superfamily hydrolase, subfamily variant 3 [Herbinix sp.]
MLKAVIFDMDGVIIDSEPMHTRAAILALQKYNVDVSLEYIHGFIGSTTYYMCQKMIEDFKINVTTEELLKVNNEMKNQLLAAEGHIVIPYIIDLMKNLYGNGIKLIIASSSPTAAIEEVMNTLKIKDYFDGFISGMMVAHPKPAPDIFLEAAKRLGVDPSECLVIEDSSNGVSAAEAAGITSIGFVNPNSGNQDLRKAAILVEGFDEVDYEFINKVYQYDHMEPATVLTTEHFILRELTTKDIVDLYPIYMKPSIREFQDDFNDDLEVEKEKQEAYIHNMYHLYGFGFWGVFLKENGQLIGRCGIELKILEDNEVYEIGYLLDDSYQGHGYAKEFVTATINYCFMELEIHRIVAVIDKNNIRSIHLAEQVGMHQFSKTMRNNRDCYLYEITYHQ